MCTRGIQRAEFGNLTGWNLRAFYEDLWVVSVSLDLLAPVGYLGLLLVSASVGRFAHGPRWYAVYIYIYTHMICQYIFIYSYVYIYIHMIYNISYTNIYANKLHQPTLLMLFESLVWFFYRFPQISSDFITASPAFRRSSTGRWSPRLSQSSRRASLHCCRCRWNRLTSWINYNDRTHRWWFGFGESSPFLAELISWDGAVTASQEAELSRLVNYSNLPKSLLTG